MYLNQTDNEATKTLCVIFIILILLINGFLIAKHVRKNQFYHSPKNMIIISMAIADVIMAMFPLVAQAKFSFEPKSRKDITGSCRLMVAYETYKYYFIHFVYGVGLVTLGAEILVRHRWKNVLYKPAAAVAVSCIPWLLGLIIVLPLCMNDMDYHNCRKTSYSKWMSIGSFFIPAALALVLTITIPFITRQSQGFYGNTMTPANCMQSTAIQMGNNSIHNHCQRMQRESTFSPDNLDMSQPSQVSPTRQHAPPSTRDADQVFTSGSVPSKEKVRLLVVTLFFIGMVSPFHFVATVSRPTFFADFPETVVTMIFSWPMVSRSYLTPLIMFLFIVRQN